jgi:hypothetical protein
MAIPDRPMTDRPDPLAPPEGYGTARPAEQPPDLSTCSCLIPGGDCSCPVAEIWWFGCTACETCGPVPYCMWHCRKVFVLPLTCGNCGAPGNVLRRETPDGTVLADWPGDMPAALQRALDRLGPG